jgi:uncharacterized membrane protein
MKPVNKMNKRTIALLCIMLLAVAGIYLGVYLTQRHYQLQNNQETEHTFVCSLSSFFNCDLVNSSPYAELFGVPVALWGIFFYIFIFILALFLLWKKEERHNSLRIAALVLHLSAIWGVLFSVYLFYVAKFIIGALCPYCIMMYAVNIGLLIGTKVASGMSYAEMRSFLSKILPNSF